MRGIAVLEAALAGKRVRRRRWQVRISPTGAREVTGEQEWSDWWHWDPEAHEFRDEQERPVAYGGTPLRALWETEWEIEPEDAEARRAAEARV